MAKAFHDLTEQEILALAVALEEEDGRIYAEFAHKLRKDSPTTAASLDELEKEEQDHRRQLIERYRERFGEVIPNIRRTDVKGFTRRKPVWLQKVLTPNMVRREVELMEEETGRFYQRAIERTTDASTRKLLGDLVAAELKHSNIAEGFDERHRAAGEHHSEAEAARRRLVLQVIQPGLAGLMDGSVSTLAPLFAAAFATKSSHDALLVGLAASVGAGISMGFAEALSDDGTLSGRGYPWLRGSVCGLMTAIGGLGHTLPYLLGDFHTATAVSVGVVAVELAVISWIRHHFMDTPLLSAAFQVVIGGVLVFIAGILIGSG